MVILYFVVKKVNLYKGICINSFVMIEVKVKSYFVQKSIYCCATWR